MRRLALLLCCLLPSLSAPAAAEGYKDPENILKALRSADKATAQAALAAVPGVPGYPAAAMDVLPALLWMAEGQDEELAAAAKAQATALGWPGSYCLPCVRKLARREDSIYRMMAIAFLNRLAWSDPGAMTILLEVNRDHARGQGPAIRAYAQALARRYCGSDLEMTDWNKRAVPLRPRMLNALAGGGLRMRPMALALLTCKKVDPMILDAAQAVVDATANAPATPVPQRP